MKKILILIAVIIFCSSAHAQNEMRVNTINDSTQRAPRMAGPDNMGNYLVVWQSSNQAAPGSKNDIYYQLFDRNGNTVGSETRVNDITAGNQEYPAAVMGKDGSFIITWTSMPDQDSSAMFDIKAKIYKNNLPAGQEFTVNTTTEYTQTNPELDIYSDGSFIVVWESWFQDGSDRGVFGQKFNSQGQKDGKEFQINTTTAYSQCRPAVKFFSNGGFIVVWESWTNTDAGYDLYARAFNSDGSQLKNEFRVNSFTADYQWFGSIAVDNDDSFAVSWCSWEQDGDDGGIYLQRFNKDFSFNGNECLLNSTARYYQWLPRIKYIKNNRIAAVWSGWKTDNSREGIYYTVIDSVNKFETLETRANLYTDSYQWEPDFIVDENSNLLLTWSSWGQFNKDYDIIFRKITPVYPSGIIKPSLVTHSSGRTTSEVIVHVMDPSLLNGHNYEVSFDTLTGKKLSMKVKDTNTGILKVNGLMLDKGDNVFYNSDNFDGISIEVKPQFSLILNLKGSGFIKESASNIKFNVAIPTTGTPLLAPVDLLVIWGRTDTLSDGRYAVVSDTALNTSSKKEIMIPFIVKKAHDGEKIDVLIIEKTSTKNKKWDAGETILLLTPKEYRRNPFNTQAQILQVLPASSVIMPAQGDTFNVRTIRPLTSNDKFTFIPSSSSVVDVSDEKVISPDEFRLFQNYPNPFNNSTKIRFTIASDADAELKVYDLLGREVKTLINTGMKKGVYTMEWNGKNSSGSTVSSGIYIYRLKSGSFIQSRKMLLLK